MKSVARKPLVIGLTALLVFTSSPIAFAAAPRAKDVLVSALDTKCNHQKRWSGTPDFVSTSQWTTTPPVLKGKTYYFKYKNPFTGLYPGKWSIVSVTMGAKSAVVRLENKEAKWEFGPKSNACPASMTITYAVVDAWLEGQG